MSKLIIRSAVIATATSLISFSSAFAQLRAFPEAEGFGAGAIGGRGGTIYHVTNLNDSGAGSFRDAVSQPNRIVVFDVGGYIPLSSSLTVKDHITIAGQTAPGQGIATRGASVSFKNSNNTIVRNMRFRQGIANGGDSVWADTTTTDVMFDHITAQWGQDETFSVTGCDRISIQNSIIGEGLLGHSMGSLIEWNTISMHHNLYISNNSRNPKTKGVNDFVNNIIYNWGTEPFIAGDSAGVSEANVVNNYFIRGPSSGADPDPFSRGNSNYHLYLSGNFYDSNKNGLLDGTLVTQGMIDDPMTYMPAPYSYPAIRMDTARRAYEKVVAGVGASYVRDPVDLRLISDLVNQTGSIITDPLTDTALGFGTITGGVAPLDTDQDGMPDTWETPRGLNPNNSADRNNVGASGYTRVEEYLNDLMTTKNAQRIWSASTGSWSTSVNWIAAIPTTDDDAFIKAANTSTNAIVNISSGKASAFRLYIGQNGAAAGEQVNVSGTGTLDVPYLITVGYQNTGILNVTGGEVDAWAISLGNTLSGTFNGTLNFSGGTVRAGRIDIGGTGSFNWSGGTLKALGNELTITPNLALTGTAGTFDTETDATIIASGLISGSLGVTKLGTGSITLSNAANSYSGPTLINGGGILTINTIANGGSACSLGTASTAAGNLVLNGGVELLFTGGGSSNRSMTIDSGGLTLATNTGIIFTLSGGMVFSGTGDRTLTIDIAGTSSNISTLSGAIGDPALGGKTSLIKNGAARLSLSGTAKTYSGDTTINAGSVLAFNTNVIPFGAGKGNVTINAGASLDVRNNININGLSGAGNLINGSGGTRTVTIGNGDASGNFSGSITSSTPITKVGTGTQIFSGINTYTGTTTINGGILQFNQATSIGGTGASVTVAAGAISAAGYAIDQAFLARHTTTSAGTIALAADSANNLDFSVAGANLPNVWLGAVGNRTFTGLITPNTTTYRLGAGTGTLTLSNLNALTGTSNVTVTGGGAIAPTNTNDYTGVTTITSGGIFIANTLANGGIASSMGAASNLAANIILDSGTIRFNTTAAQSTDRLFTLTQNGGTLENNGAGPVSFGNTGSIVMTGSGNRTLTLGGSHYNNIGNNAFSLQVGDPATGSTSLAKTGSGRWFLQGSPKTYSGDTIIQAGDLYTSVTNVLPYGAGKGDLVVNGGRLFLFSGNLNLNAISGTGGAIGASGSKTLTIGNDNSPGSYAGSITNAITLVKTGTGTQTFTGVINYTGNTTVNAGKLIFDNTAIKGNGTLAISSNSSVEVLANGTSNSVTLIKSLTTTGTGAHLEIHDNDIILDYTGGANSYASTVSKIKSGLVLLGGAGTDGITSADVDSQTIPGTILAVVDDGNISVGGAITELSGFTIPNPNSSVLVKFTWFGDSNLDGSVDGSDYALIDTGFTSGGALSGWVFGDYDYSGAIDSSDYALIDTGFISQNTILPEPTSIALLSLAMLAMSKRTRSAAYGN